MEEFVNEKLTDMLKDEVYSQVQCIVERPLINENEVSQFWRLAFPYIIQRIKMWNGYAITAQNLASLVIRKQQQTAFANSSPIASVDMTTPRKMKMGDRPVFPISKLDFMTYLVNKADSIVAHDILRVMSKFQVSIPLILQNIYEKGKFIITVPLIQDTVIKWESTPGQIVENHLFRSKFQMVTAIRLDTNKIGKSTILNQLMSKPYMFSSKSEPGSKYGRPSTLDGAVEIVWLTQATCSESTWKTTMSEHYKGNTENVIILANLHGDALNHPHILKYLGKYSSSFIVFMMPDSSERELVQLRHCIKSERIVKVLVDPHAIEDDENSMNIIRTDSLSCDDTLDTIRCLLQDSLKCQMKEGTVIIEESKHPHESLRYADALHCKKSEEIVALVRKHGCFKIKQFLIGADLKRLAKWDSTLRSLIKLFLDLLSLPTKDAKKHLAHMETHLSQLSTTESMTARTEVSEAKEKLRCILKVPSKKANGSNSEARQKEEALRKSELEAAITKVDNMNLGQEHFFRALGQMYENSKGVVNLGEFTSIRHLPNQFADLLINGHAIEMLNGDSGKIQLIWLKAIFDNVVKKLPKLKVFVISIIGLQSSGKSTLLNALFSCRFAVSVGRCSRGLFMRMIFLNKTLRRSHGYDAIILIDTEGLSSPETMNDPNASQKDRLMATFAIGISNLTIVNILGEGMTEVTDILQVAFVAMARLREGNIRPDLLMVQHSQERNDNKMDQAKDQFCEAINKAFDLISKNDVEIGSASAECLTELTERIKSGDLFQHFGPFKDGSSVSSPPSESYHDDIVFLLKNIFKRSEVSLNKISFNLWCNRLESYWTCVQEEQFALNFKNVKQITDFLHFEKEIAKVKELHDRAIRHHCKIFAKTLRNAVSTQIAEGRKTESENNRKKLLAGIEQELKLIPHSCRIKCEFCKQFNENLAALFEEMNNSEWMEGATQSLQKYYSRLHETTMKNLQQMFDGSLVRQGFFSKFSDEIEKQLIEALLKRPSGIYSEGEQKIIIKEIWKKLQVIAAKVEEDDIDLEKRMDQALQLEYGAKFPTILDDLKNEITFDLLLNSERNVKVTRHLDKKLRKDELHYLIKKINDLVDTVFRNRCVEFGKTGLNFEEGMVIEIKSVFPEEIKQFEKKFRMKLHDAFKIILQTYALQYFRKRMAELQELWDSQNKPCEILKQKEHDYITDIQTILESGFSSAGEGAVMATKLCKVAKQRAILAGFDIKIELIKNISWTLNSEKVRLRYFGELAKEVAVGKKERAVKHFQNPKDSIEAWYKHRVDTIDVNDKAMKTYNDTIYKELKSLARQISNCSTKAQIRGIVVNYLKDGDDKYISKVKIKDHDFGALRDSIKHKLQTFSESVVKSDVAFPLASGNSTIMARMGCTEHCFWCGSLCWGSRNHHMGKHISGIEVHHSCHQPSGLKDTRDKCTRKLLSTACHNRTDQTPVWFKDDQDEGMLWLEAKQIHFKEWNFDAHCTTKFDELMRWFFQELHYDLAKITGSLPADEKDLIKNKCKNLNIQAILNCLEFKM